MGHFDPLTVEEIAESPDIKENLVEHIALLEKIGKELANEHDLFQVPYWEDFDKVVKAKLQLVLNVPNSPLHYEVKESMEHITEVALYMLLRHHMNTDPNKG